MKYSSGKTVGLVLGLILIPALASAQRPVPDGGMIVVGGDIGLLFSGDEALENAPTYDIFFEYYFTQRVGLRGTLGYADPEFEAGDDDSLAQSRILGTLLYNWEHGVWHPFAGAGLGAHLLQFKDDGAGVGDRETRLGFHLGGGIEYFARREITIIGQGFYHIVDDDDDDGGIDPSGLTLTGGLKVYF